MNEAASGSDFLTAAAHVTATAAALPLAIQAILVPDASGRIVLPAGASIDDVSVSGADLIVTLPNGQVLIIPNGPVDIPSIVIAEIGSAPDRDRGCQSVSISVVVVS